MAIEHDHAEPDARDHALPGSAVAAHRVGASSASIPAEFFVITATMPVRCHQEMKQPISHSRLDLPIPAFKDQIEGEHNLFPDLIANNSQLEEESEGCR
jgi:hypothetical protein